MGDAFFSSLGAVAVLIIYILLFSMVAGALLNQQEIGNDLFDTVPDAMWYVIARFVSQQHSLPNVKGTPTAVTSTILLVAVGLFQGIIFLLPIDRLKTASKVSEKAHNELETLRYQIDEETIRAQLPTQFVWMENPHCPVMRVQVYQDRMEGLLNAGIAVFPVPILSSSFESAQISVGIMRGEPQRMFGEIATLEVSLTWEPTSAVSTDPEGNLTVLIVSGSSFKIGRRWRCCVEVPTSLYGQRKKWTSEASLIGGGSIVTWGADATCTFPIKWETHTKIKSEPPDDQFLKDLANLVEDGAQRLQNIEDVVAKLNT